MHRCNPPTIPYHPHPLGMQRDFPASFSFPLRNLRGKMKCHRVLSARSHVTAAKCDNQKRYGNECQTDLHIYILLECYPTTEDCWNLLKVHLANCFYKIYFPPIPPFLFSIFALVCFVKSIHFVPFVSLLGWFTGSLPKFLQCGSDKDWL